MASASEYQLKALGALLSQVESIKDALECGKRALQNGQTLPLAVVRELRDNIDGRGNFHLGSYDEWTDLLSPADRHDIDPPADDDEMKCCPLCKSFHLSEEQAAQCEGR